MEPYTLEQMYFLVQIFAGIAVVGSLIYVGLQVKQNTQTLQIIAQRDSSTEYISYQRMLIQDEELLELVMRSETDPDSLNELEKRRAWGAVDIMIEMSASEFYRFRRGVLPAYAWESIERVLHDLMAMQVYQEYWDARKHSYPEEYQSFVNQVIKEGGSASWNH
jgi:uncharacterized membrane protein